MSKTSVRDFDPDVCMGRTDEFDQPCPKMVPIGEDTGRGVVDRLGRIEKAAMDAAGLSEDRDESEFKCGMCSCPLVNLALSGMAPTECPRLESHQ